MCAVKNSDSQKYKIKWEIYSFLSPLNSISTYTAQKQGAFVERHALSSTKATEYSLWYA